MSFYFIPFYPLLCIHKLYSQFLVLCLVQICCFTGGEFLLAKKKKRTESFVIFFVEFCTLPTFCVFVTF